MTLRVYLHSKSKRAETLALLDSGATENFMSLDYAKHLHLPIKTLQEPRRLFNVDGTPNKAGDLKYYTDLGTRTGTSTRMLRYFLSDLGDSRVILGYPWFAAAQPKIDWARGWIAHDQLPIVLRSVDAAKAQFLPRQATARQGIATKRAGPPPRRSDSVPLQYRDYRDVFEQRKGKGLPPSRTWDHAIDLKPRAPATLISKTIRLSQAEQGELSKFLKEHTARGTIQPSKSPYAASFFFIKKKNGKLRPVQDYRPVNAWTIKNRYPLPLIPSLIDRLRDCTKFTGVDIEWGYNEVLIKPKDRWKAAFITNEGLYEPTVMFFGLTNSPATFQTMMNTIFRDLIDEGNVTIYMDDIAIHTGPRPGESEHDHTLHHRTLVRRVLERLRTHDLHLNPEKCVFEQDHLDFLGVRVGGGTVQMEQSKVDRVSEWTRPRNVREVCKFLGFTGYYRYFIQGYSQIARPLLDLTKQATPWHWDDKEQGAFEVLRDKMVSKPVLQQPDFDKTFYLQTNASKYGVGAVLSQDGGTKGVTLCKRHPVAYYSATFTPTEQNYDAHDLEFLGVFKLIEHWRPYLIWTKEPFVIETDHKNLTYWKSPRKLTGRTARWHEKLQDYNFKILHVAGKNNTPADALSRPCDDE